jgi:hypothetical protein
LGKVIAQKVGIWGRSVGTVKLRGEIKEVGCEWAVRPGESHRFPKILSVTTAGGHDVRVMAGV